MDTTCLSAIKSIVPQALKNITDDTLGAKKGKFSNDGRLITAKHYRRGGSFFVLLIDMNIHTLLCLIV